MSAESAPSGAEQSNSMGSSGATQTAERASAPVSSVGTHTDGGRFNESIAHTAPLSPGKSSFSKDTHQSFRASDFQTIAINNSNKRESAKNFQAERQSLEKLFKESTPLDVSRSGHSADTSQPFHAHEFRTIWSAPHSEKQPEKQESQPVIQQHSEVVKYSQESKLDPTPIQTEQTQPLQNHETVLWQAKQTENSFHETISVEPAKPPTSQKTAPDQQEFTHSAVETHQHIDHDKPASQLEKPADSRVNMHQRQHVETSRQGQQKAEPKHQAVPKGENRMTKAHIKHHTPLLEHIEVQKTLQKAEPHAQEKLASTQPVHKGQKVELNTQTYELLKAFRAQTQQDQEIMQSQPAPKVEIGRITESQVHVALNPEGQISTQPSMQEADAVIETFVQAAKVTQLMEQTGMQTETAQERVLHIVHETLQKQKLQNAAEEVMRQELPEENPSELPPKYFNRDEATDAVRKALALKAAVENQDKSGKVDGAQIADELPDGNAEIVKSELVKDTNIRDGSMEEFRDELRTTHTNSLEEMKEKIDETIHNKPAVALPEKDERESVTSEDVRRVYGTQDVV